MLVVAAMEPRSRGTLRVIGADPSAPLIDHGYLSDPQGHDRAVLAEGSEQARELAASEPLREMIGDELAATARPIDSSTRTTTIPSERARWALFGSARRVRGAGRVYGLEGVVVADCSLMPVIPRANTNIPAVLVGERIAETLLEREPLRAHIGAAGIESGSADPERSRRIPSWSP